MSAQYCAPTNIFEGVWMVELHDQTLRDAHQSILATRMRTEDMLPIASKMDEIGFWSMEVWGGATFDVPIRFLNESPWERIRVLKEAMPNTKMQMLERAMNVVAYWNFPDDVVKRFIGLAKKNGVDYFRIFDALNDLRNMETPIKAVLDEGGHAQGCISYTISPVHTIERYVDDLIKLESWGCQSVCIKDMAGMISPKYAQGIIRGYKDAGGKVPIDLHSHYTSGMTGMSYWAACEAGVDVLDTSMSPISGGTGGAPTESVVAALQGTKYDTGYDLKQLIEIRKYFMEIWHKYRHLIRQEAIKVDPSVMVHQIPGGMLSNLVNQLRQMDALDRLDDVFETLPKVRKDLGQVPLVTPTSQIVGIQTVNNVLFDKKEGEYAQITEQVKDLCYGLYGKTSKPMNPEVQKKALKDYPKGDIPITTRPGDVIEPEFENVKKEVEGLAKNIDDEILCALYPVTGKRFLRWKYGLENIPDDVKPKTLEQVKNDQELVKKALSGELTAKTKKDKPANLRSFDVYVDGEHFNVEVADPNVRHFGNVSIKKKENKAEETDESGALKAPIPGMIIEFKKKVGDEVKADETVVVLEAMKMFNNLSAPCDGKISAINFKAGDSVAKGDVLCVIE
jgi:pyruvate/oxaloacetate carboxyltransferase